MARKRYGIIIAALAILIIVAAVAGVVLRSDGGGSSGDGDASLGSALAAPDGAELSTFDSFGDLSDEAAVASQAYSAALQERGTFAPADGAAAGPDLQSLLDRKIIQSTSVDIEVKDVGKDFQEIIRIADTAGGFVASSTFSNVDDQQVADLTIRVPASRYQQVLADIRLMGDVARESSDANDVTEEFTDLQARLRTLEASEQRFLELLAQADGINEILIVQDRLDNVRGQIEQTQGRINLLNNLTDLATITVHLRPVAFVAETPPPNDGGGAVDPLEVAGDAWEASLDTLLVLAAISLAVVAYSWWLVPPLALFAIITRWWVTRRPGTASQAPM